jgi:hypothetical protein
VDFLSRIDDRRRQCPSMEPALVGG